MVRIHPGQFRSDCLIKATFRRPVYPLVMRTCVRYGDTLDRTETTTGCHSGSRRAVIRTGPVSERDRSSSPAQVASAATLRRDFWEPASRRTAASDAGSASGMGGRSACSSITSTVTAGTTGSTTSSCSARTVIAKRRPTGGATAIAATGARRADLAGGGRGDATPTPAWPETSLLATLIPLCGVGAHTSRLRGFSSWPRSERRAVAGATRRQSSRCRARAAQAVPGAPRRSPSPSSSTRRIRSARRRTRPSRASTVAS